MKGEFRVQEEFGGSSTAAHPSEEFIGYATQALEKAAAASGVAVSAILYARVDLVNALPLRLMEIELIEPSLFLRTDVEAGSRFAAAVARRLKVESVTVE